ncbi:signal protein [Streptomyces sp. NPDC086783]|uniref:signal protein n=1 Tax=Streptomyces sp. NPDC086783 TaxID=3365758 RepID=UPI00381C871E
MKFRGVGVGAVALALAASAGCGAGTGSKDERDARPKATAKRSAPAPSESATASAPAEFTRLSSAELQGRWWTWAASEPEATNPVTDPDGSQCARNQPKDVWFLAGTFGTRVDRACTVPDGVPLAFPLVNLFGTREDCASFMASAEGRATLDGRRIEPETHKGRTVTVVGTADNPLTGTSGRYEAVGCGLWVQLPPLEPGAHSLTIRGSSGDFSVGADYALTVVPDPRGTGRSGRPALSVGLSTLG